MKTKNIIENVSRAAITETEGFACGPCGVTAVDAEIEIEQGGEKLFLSAQWVDACGDELYFSVTKESAFHLNTLPDLSDDEIEELQRIRDTEVECDLKVEYPNQFQKLIKMVNKKLNQLGFEYDLFNEEGLNVEYL